MVAKTFQGLPQIGEPFESGGKMYINVQCKNGSVRRVRWYDVPEYMKMYPEAKREDIDKYYKSKRRTICGDGGYVWVLEGAKEYNDMLQMNPSTRYNTYFGWFVRSDVEDYILKALEEICMPHKLYWEEVSIDDNTLLPREEVRKIVMQKCGGRASYEVGLD